jgi:hypothetical protein
MELILIVESASGGVDMECSLSMEKPSLRCGVVRSCRRAWSGVCCFLSPARSTTFPMHSKQRSIVWDNSPDEHGMHVRCAPVISFATTSHASQVWLQCLGSVQWHGIIKANGYQCTISRRRMNPAKDRQKRRSSGWIVLTSCAYSASSAGFIRHDCVISKLTR